MTRKLLTTFLLTAACIMSMAQEKPKTGWGITPLPMASFSSDNGIQLGAMCDAYCYGDGSIYPNYLHKLSFEYSYYTKGSTVLHGFYDSSYLIPGIRLTAAASFIRSTLYPFYGFNGTSATWFDNLDKNLDEGYAYYNYARDMARLTADLQGKLYGNWKWIGGVSFWNYSISDHDTEIFSNTASLYRDYIEAGLIDADQANGGSHIEFKGGVSYDSRDHQTVPTSGISAEAYLYGSPDFFQSWKNNYLKLALHYRQYIGLVPERVVLAYHLAYQGLVAGEAPFYTLQNINVLYLLQTMNDGLGSKNTIRGTLYNRFVGNGMAWSNFECRIRLFSIDLFKQHWYVATNPFFDAGKIVQPYRLDQLKRQGMIMDDAISLYSGQPDKLHCSAGIGGQLVMNYNMVLSAEIAKTFRKEDGNFGLNLGLNYIF